MSGTSGAEGIATVAGKRAALAMTHLSLSMHRSVCPTCKHGGPLCADGAAARRAKDRLTAELAEHDRKRA